MKYENIPTGLNQAILERITHLEHRNSIQKRYSFSLVGFLSIAALIPATTSAWNSLLSSGVGEYISLVLSDSTNIASYWKEILLSISEAFPVTDIIIALVAIFVCLWTFDKLRSVVQETSLHQAIIN